MLKIKINRWQDIDWPYANLRVVQWQKRIYSASKQGNIKEVRKLQHCLLNSIEAKFVSVRRVTQDNRGKSTAGVDDIKNVEPNKRIKLAHSLEINGEKGSPLRRVWIPKPGKTEKRPLGIPTIKDRCLQALFKLALEPEWEARFEPNSYGFRPGKNCHDAMSAVRAYIQKRSKYVLDADITKCFDRINHNYLLEKIGMTGKYRRQLKGWLQSGILDKDIFSPVELGTPQGGVISPLLANIALHGLEKYLKTSVKNITTYGRTGKKIKPSRNEQSLGVVRYADDFVIIHSDLGVILNMFEKTKEFLKPIGLEISMEKTRITNTLSNYGLPQEINQIKVSEKPGFNFLGFYIRQYETNHSSAYGPDRVKLGFKTLIIPQKEKCKIHQQKLHQIILKTGKALDQDALIKLLNEQISGWSRYFGRSDANTQSILTQMDYLLYLKLRRWSKRVKGTFGKGASCWKQIGNNRWTFATKLSVMTNHYRYSNPLSKYVKVKAEKSPFDSDDIYWTKRLSINNLYKTSINRLMKKQKSKCAWCNETFIVEEVFEVDHIVPISKGGSKEFENLQLLHGHCHDIKTSKEKLDSTGT